MPEKAIYCRNDGFEFGNYDIKKLFKFWSFILIQITLKVSFLARDRKFFIPYRDISYRDRDRERHSVIVLKFSAIFVNICYLYFSYFRVEISSKI